MLTREQLHALLCMRKRRVTLFSILQKELIPYMGQACMAHFDPDSEIAKLLHHIAYGDLQLAQTMLETNPRLVLQAGHVETPSGLKVMHTTPLECALGAGDPEMAKMIEPYFDSDNIAGGATVREEQYARYRTHIENMQNQQPYDFTLLLATLKQASPEDVTAALNNNMEHKSALREVLEQFRKDFTPGKITVGMHFNYQHLLHAYEVNTQEYRHLLNGNNGDKNTIFCCQVIGFIQRSLPAIDRMVFAQSLTDVAGRKAKIERTFQSIYADMDFLVTAGGYSSHSGLGFEYAACGAWGSWTQECKPGSGGLWALFCRAKTGDLQNLCDRFEKKRSLVV